MGAFNILTCKSPKTGEDLRLQFKAGERWQYEYKIGDKVIDRTNELAGACLVGAIVESPMSPVEDEYYSITINDAVIQSVAPIPEAEYDRLEGELDWKRRGASRQII